MKRTLVLGLAFSLLIFYACKAKKAATTPTTQTTQTPISSGSGTSPFPLVATDDGTRAPAEPELAAIRLRFNETTLEQLKEGHKIYTAGACINCHGSTNIHLYSENQWTRIIDDMSQRAELSEAQKTALSKYVISIKSTQ